MENETVKRRIVKKTVKTIQKDAPICTIRYFNCCIYIVEKLTASGGWVVDKYYSDIDKQTPAVFYNRTIAEDFVKGKFGQQTEEVVWTNFD